MDRSLDLFAENDASESGSLTSRWCDAACAAPPMPRSAARTNLWLVRKLSHAEAWAAVPLLTEALGPCQELRFVSGAGDGREDSAALHVEYTQWTVEYFLKLAALAAGEVFGAFDDLHSKQPASVAITFPPGSERRDRDLSAAILEELGPPPMWLSQFARGSHAKSRHLAFVKEVEELHDKVVGDRAHFYLMTMGTCPRKQGCGAGSAILQRLIRTARDAQMPLYSETSGEGNLKFFGSRELRIVEQTDAFGGVHSMIFDPLLPCDEIPHMYKVIGGIESNGIVVRESKSITSKECGRLPTGALLVAKELIGNRLCYELRRGTGPIRGWVSIRTKDRLLCEEHFYIGDAEEGISQKGASICECETMSDLGDCPLLEEDSSSESDWESIEPTEATSKDSPTASAKTVVAWQRSREGAVVML